MIFILFLNKTKVNNQLKVWKKIPLKIAANSVTVNDRCGICKICEFCLYIMNMLTSVKSDTIKGPHLPIRINKSCVKYLKTNAMNTQGDKIKAFLL